MLALRSVGRGYSGALKVTSIMNLSKPINANSWKEHVKALSSNCEHLIEENLKKDAVVAKSYTQAQTQLISQTPDKPDTPAEKATRFEGSRNTRGWSAKDGIVDVCFKETGKVIDVVIKISDCAQWERMKAKQLSGEIEYVDYSNWYVQYKLEFPMIHDGSAQVLNRFSLFL